MAHPSQVQYYNEPVEKQLGFAAIVQTDKTLRLSGIVAVDAALNVVGKGDMAAQVKRIYDIMEETLAMNGATLEHVVAEVIYTTNMAAFAEAGATRAQRYAKCAPPATTAVQVSGLFLPDAMIEIQATAVVP
jgi:enamine deaminase RidA (YjgF/YER057c/UK114 family)